MYSAEDLLDMITEPVNVTDSPDLGPPPVAHFEEGDPIKFGNNQGLSSKKTGGEVTDGNNPPLPANLETRRKRRESSHHLETSRPVTVDTLSITGQPLKSGAKRKLNARDDEDPVEKISEKDDFRFNRRSAGSTTSENSLEADKGHSIIQKVSQDIATVREMSRDKSKAAPLPTTTTARKALGPSKFTPAQRFPISTDMLLRKRKHRPTSFTSQGQSQRLKRQDRRTQR